MKLKIGDIFRVEVQSGKYIFGRVVFDINKQYCKNISDDISNYLMFFAKHYVIQTFKGVYDDPDADFLRETIIDSVITRSKIFKDGYWPIIGNIEIDPKKVSFPETLALKNNKLFFECGEIQIELPVSYKYRDEKKIYPTLISPITIYAGTLFYQGLQEYIDEEHFYPQYLEGSDLRFRPDVRKEVYDMMGEELGQTYYEMALKYGFDITRFY